MHILQCSQHLAHDPLCFLPRNAMLLTRNIFIHGASVQILHDDICRSVLVQLVVHIDHVRALSGCQRGHNPCFLQKSFGQRPKFLLLPGEDFRMHVRQTSAILREVFLDTLYALQTLIESNIGDPVSAPANFLPDNKSAQLVSRLQAVGSVRDTGYR